MTERTQPDPDWIPEILADVSDWMEGPPPRHDDPEPDTDPDTVADPDAVLRRIRSLRSIADEILEELDEEKPEQETILFLLDELQRMNSKARAFVGGGSQDGSRGNAPWSGVTHPSRR